MPHPRGRWPRRTELVRLAQAAQENEPRALDALLAALRPALDAFFARRIPGDAADDLTQAALIRIARDVGRLDPMGVGHHVTTVARTLLNAESLRQVRATRLFAPATHGEAVESPLDIERETEYEELVRAIRRASASKLPPELRAVVLGLLSDLSVSEIAADLRVDPFAIRMRLLRARALLRRELWAYIDRGMRAGTLLTFSMLGLQSVC